MRLYSQTEPSELTSQCTADECYNYLDKDNFINFKQLDEIDEGRGILFKFVWNATSPNGEKIDSQPQGHCWVS